MKIDIARKKIESDLKKLRPLWDRINTGRKERDDYLKDLIKNGGFLDIKKELVEGMKPLQWAASYGDMMEI